MHKAGGKLLREAYAVWKGVQADVELGLALQDFDVFRGNLRAVAKV